MEQGNQNLTLLELAAHALGDVLAEVTFVGGCTTILLVDPAAFGGVRQTDDVDVIVDVVSLLAYQQLSKRLRRNGFAEDREGPICRWIFKEGEAVVRLDVMPNSPEILGFSNRWYADAMANAEMHTLPSGTQISVVNPGYFLATKFEAFNGRGKGDYAASHDLEDIIFVLENRVDLMKELYGYPADVKRYLGQQARLLLNDEFLNVLPGQTEQGGEEVVTNYLELMARWVDS